jgi:hypothetical protein
MIELVEDWLTISNVHGYVDEGDLPLMRLHSDLFLGNLLQREQCVIWPDGSSNGNVRHFAWQRFEKTVTDFLG